MRVKLYLFLVVSLLCQTHPSHAFDSAEPELTLSLMKHMKRLFRCCVRPRPVEKDSEKRESAQGRKKEEKKPLLKQKKKQGS